MNDAEVVVVHLILDVNVDGWFVQVAWLKYFAEML